MEDFRRRFPGENDRVEFKTGTGNQPLQDAIVAFSNAEGGVIFVGVNDEGDVVGRELNQGTLDTITQAFRDTRDPGRYAIREIQIDDIPVVAITIAKRIEGFAQTSNGRILARRGTQKAPLFGDELRRLLMARSLVRFEQHDSGVDLATISRPQLERVGAIFDWPSDDGPTRDRLRERGLLLPQSDSLTFAGAAYLLADPAEALGKAFIEILRFPTANADYDRRSEIRGPLDQQVTRATQQVADELGHELVVLGLQRHEIPRLPVVVLREAIANAVAHRAYEAAGTAIRIEIRPDGVKVISPGGLPEPVTEQNIRDAQAARNVSMISVLRRAGLAEDAGRGIDVMVDAMRSELLDPPRFRDLGHAVEVFLPVRSAVTVAERAWVREIEARGLIQPTDRLILVHAARGERLSNSRVRELLSIDSADARQALGRLRDAHLLEQHGTRGGATYVLAEALGAPAGLHLSPAGLEDLLVEMAAEEPLTNISVRQRTGLDRAQALRALDSLVVSGRLKRVGERRGTRYVVAEQSAE
jgi:ATP-dependent DNA helicase RecG